MGSGAPLLWGDSIGGGTGGKPFAQLGGISEFNRGGLEAFRKVCAPQPPASGIYADQRYVAFRRPHPPCSLLLLSRPLGGVGGVRGSGGRAPIAPPTPRSSLFFVLPAPSSVVLPRPPSLFEEGERSPWHRVPALALYRPFDIRAQRRNPVEGVSANFRGALQASAAAVGKHRRIANM